MNARLFRCAAFMTVLPLGGVILIFALKNNSAAINIILPAVIALQLPVVFLCRRAVKPFICPDTEILVRMGVEYVPAAYEPGRFKIDSRVSSFMIWLSLVPPLLAWLSIRFPREVSISVLNFAVYKSPLPELAIPALILPFVASLALPFWFECARASAIFSEGSERKRYLLRGFAERLERLDAPGEYLKARKKI